MLIVVAIWHISVSSMIACVAALITIATLLQVMAVLGHTGVRVDIAVDRHVLLLLRVSCILRAIVLHNFLTGMIISEGTLLTFIFLTIVFTIGTRG